MSRTLKSLLACWMAVAATGTVVSHRHTASAGSGHGYGWLALAGPTDPVVESNPHRHFVLGGVEFGAVPDSNPPSDSARLDSVLAACHTLADHPQLDPPPVVGMPPALFPSPVAAPRVGQVSPAPLALCPVARHARTGVLLS